eukprot:1157301-Pelagomonas_calceolata.AAC.3
MTNTEGLQGARAHRQAHQEGQCFAAWTHEAKSKGTCHTYKQKRGRKQQPKSASKAETVLPRFRYISMRHQHESHARTRAHTPCAHPLTSAQSGAG